MTKAKLENLHLKEKIQKLDIKIMKNKNHFDKRLLKFIKNLKIKLTKADIKIDIGTENAALTAILVPFICTILSMIYSKNTKKAENKIYHVNPVYTNENLINIIISGIFEIKMIHIINIIYILSKKEGVGKDERTSNRRTYDYSYE